MSRHAKLGFVVSAFLLLLAAEVCKASGAELGTEEGAYDIHSYFFHRFRDSLTNEEQILRQRGNLCHNITGSCFLLDREPPHLVTKRSPLSLEEKDQFKTNRSVMKFVFSPQQVKYNHRHDDMLHSDENHHGKQQQHGKGVYYLCATGNQWVPASLRCDGIEQCHDGTDELHCEMPPEPLWDVRLRRQALKVEKSEAEGHHGSERRRFAAQFSESTCIGCRCKFGDRLPLMPDPVTKQPHPWLKFALAAHPSDAFRLQFPFNVGCDPDQTAGIAIQLFKKNSRYCNKAVCCAEQEGCLACTNVAFSQGLKCRTI